MTAMSDALQKAGYDTTRDEVYALVSRMRAKGTSLRAIETEVWQRCVRRPVLFGPVIAAYVERIDADMQFRHTPDGGHDLRAQEGQPQGAAETSSGDEGHEPIAESGQDVRASSPDETSREDGQTSLADPAIVPVPPSRDELTDAGRTLRQERERLRQSPGAGAMQARAYETRARVFGESWLLTYAIPDGPRLLSLRAGEVRPMMQRMAREGAARVHAWVLLQAVATELDAMGQVHEDMKLENVLLPATVARLADAYAPDVLMAKARAHFNSFQKLENANG
jgi:hypothetical protein